MNVLITGANGQLGSEIKDLEEQYSHFNFFFRDLPDLDICVYNQLKEFVTDYKINAVINCAAYTAVDNAEKDKETAYKVNAEGVFNLVQVLERNNGKLIHISTDYVFNGTKSMPYHEGDIVYPIGVYGQTKREGELAVINSNVEGVIIRTSWLYSSYGNNFVKTIMRIGKEKKELKVIFDQVGTPTFAGDLARTCLDILSKVNRRIDEDGKVYHFSNEGVTSWYDFAKTIIQFNNFDCTVFPIETKDYPTSAQRPHYSVLNKSKIKNDFNISIPYWRDSLEKCITKLITKKN